MVTLADLHTSRLLITGDCEQPPFLTQMPSAKMEPRVGRVSSRMSKLIFRNLGGRVVPIRVETEWHQDALSISRYQVPKRPFDPKAYATEQAFVNPNAVCGQCGASVYYYEHPNGARVLFDQLGPPWPKHPCYEAGQAINRNVITQATTAAGPRWVQEGWQPLFYQKHIVLQSGEALRVQARTKRYQVIFEVPLATLQQRYIQIEQVCRLLMQAKEDAGKVLIQIHDGSRSFEITTKNSRQIEQAVPLQTATQLTEAQFASLTKLDVAIQCQRDGKRWHVNLSRHDKNHALDFKAKSFERLKPFIYRLEAWVSKPNKNGNQVVYLLETLNRHFISSVIPADVFSASYPAVEKAAISAAKANLDVQAERLEVTSITSDLAASKLVCGTLGENQIKIRVDDRLFRLGESATQITAGKTLIFLRQIKDPEESKAEFALYIHKAGELMSVRPRGYVSQLAREVLVSPVSPANKDNIDRAGQRTVRHKAFSVTLSSVDLSKDEQIFLVVTDMLQEYRLRLHSVSKKVRGQIAELTKNHHRHTTHLVRRSGHSYQFHINGQFIVMASEEAFFEQRTRRRVDDISDMRDRPKRTVDSVSVSISEQIKKNAHLEQHGLGAALLEAVKSIKKSSV